MRILRNGAIALVAIAAALYLANASWLWGTPGKPTLLAHRGLAQQFSREGLTNETCTAAQMLPPTHAYLENTIPSIKAAFDLGADMVEIDIHPTTDGEFAVFHDWTVDCRTNGKGVTRELAMTYLRTLDIGHGYTADGGKTFPFRGQFVGAMPTLAEVLAAFPKERFLINIKSRDKSEADLLHAYLKARDTNIGRLAFYGANAPIEQLRTHLPAARMLSRRILKDCAFSYLATGWFGRVPDDCRNSLVFLPINYRYLAWGWPNLLAGRLREVNSELFVIGAYDGASYSSAVDDPEAVAPFVDGYAGGISTDRIDVMGPALKP